MQTTYIYLLIGAILFTTFLYLWLAPQPGKAPAEDLDADIEDEPKSRSFLNEVNEILEGKPFPKEPKAYVSLEELKKLKWRDTGNPKVKKLLGMEAVNPGSPNTFVALLDPAADNPKTVRYNSDKNRLSIEYGRDFLTLNSVETARLIDVIKSANANYGKGFTYFDEGNQIKAKLEELEAYKWDDGKLEEVKRFLGMETTNDTVNKAISEDLDKIKSKDPDKYGALIKAMKNATDIKHIGIDYGKSETAGVQAINAYDLEKRWAELEKENPVMSLGELRQALTEEEKPGRYIFNTDGKKVRVEDLVTPADPNASSLAYRLEEVRRLNKRS